ncbi:Anthranilate/para-aminobenzoate synthases component I (TrpE) (PDB:1I1Q) [Commensalibacter communis]|uniref:anthranilate synthase component I n=1 Tax=Commensalibacter communis TaxID=2972786 RepID=UPI0022FF883E|nr:anthranilate synthase component I [Commensalibacter communis]CAI3922956.1 Anthranilate/para-aminobenzoate synthases component I (TrpE) (PDB:1I1Q) [Commensalibacter communis]CAI3936240.1 Anthranilate/para-aminobenzoate synthases component I (TrpE) (PDB:1I1Q) [Commensalibacter communis]
MSYDDFIINKKQTVIYTVKSADLITPVSAFLQLSAIAGEDPKNIFLLESVQGGVSRARYSIIGLLPDVIWKCKQGKVSINTDPLNHPDQFIAQDIHPIQSLQCFIADSQLDIPEDIPPMVGGIFGYLGYDMVRQMEHLPNPPKNDLNLPEGIMIRPSIFAIFDTVLDELTLAVPLRGKTAEEQERAKRLLEKAQAALNEPLPSDKKIDKTSIKQSETPISTFTKDEFKQAVDKIKEYIFEGDAFQVVPSQRFSIPFTLPPIALYRSLRKINPAPFLFCLQLENFALVGSSPEILVRLRDGTVTVRPLAGTRPRGKTPEEDLQLEQDLLADQKELAEHLMLIDLGRNDVGRVSEIGSVKVTEQFVIERFSHVMHISSNVEGKLKENLTALDALIAGFPAGTLTGAPKIRAMEILDEIEHTQRATYAGCIGYFGADGSMDTCIGLRTALIKDDTMYVQAGCGVVADSDPEAEYEETRHKARALFRAAEDAHLFVPNIDPDANKSNIITE